LLRTRLSPWPSHRGFAGLPRCPPHCGRRRHHPCGKGQGPEGRYCPKMPPVGLDAMHGGLPMAVHQCSPPRNASQTPQVLSRFSCHLGVFRRSCRVDSFAGGKHRMGVASKLFILELGLCQTVHCRTWSHSRSFRWVRFGCEKSQGRYPHQETMEGSDFKSIPCRQSCPFPL